MNKQTKTILSLAIIFSLCAFQVISFTHFSLAEDELLTESPIIEETPLDIPTTEATIETPVEPPEETTTTTIETPVEPPEETTTTTIITEEPQDTPTITESVLPVQEQTPVSNPQPQPELSTDKADYAPGETVSIFGRFFQSLQNIVLKIFGGSEQENNYTESTNNVTTDEQGSFVSQYLLDNVFRPIYTVIANALNGEELAKTTFTDATKGKIIVTKIVSGGSATANSFTITGSGTCFASPYSLPGSSTGATYECKNANNESYTYSITEIPPSDYSVSYGSNCSGTITRDDIKSCTVTNTYVVPSCDATACNANDGWYDTINKQWVSTGQCTEKEQKQQEYKDYSCVSDMCTSSVTGTQWVDTGNTRNKLDETACDDGKFCTLSDVCTSGVCGGSARDCSASNILGISTCDNDPDFFSATFDWRNPFTSICDETNDKCSTGDNIINHVCADADNTDGVFNYNSVTQTCSAECDGVGTECQPKIASNYCYYVGSCNTNPTACSCDYRNNQYCPATGTVTDGICYYGTQSCTEGGCGLSTEAMSNYDTCDPNLGPIDTIPPVIDSHGDETAEATGSTGAVVTYTSPVTHDAVDGDGTATCLPVSGSTFALEDTTVTCTAEDAAGNHAIPTTFKVTVLDTTPPVVTVPSDITEEATSPSGNVITFSASASDIVDGSITPTCIPASGSTFPITTTEVTCTAIDAHSNTGSASFNVIVQDTLPPTTTDNVPSAWQTAPFDVIFSCTDSGSGCSKVYYTTDGNDPTTLSSFADAASNWKFNVAVDGTYTIKYRGEDVVGNLEGVKTAANQLKIDQTPPVISGAPTTSANSNGWYNSSVTVHFNCTDSGSGVYSVTPDTTLTGEDASQHVLGTCVDNAGNSANFDVTGINIDQTAPSIDGAPTTSPNSNGWYKNNVVVHYTCTDALSGVDTLTSDQTLIAEAADQSTMGTCADKAGNSADKTVSGISIDKTAPTISGSRTPLANSFGWNNTDVTVHFECNDALSGITSCTPDEILAGESASQSRVGTVIDKADNTNTATVSDINIDKTAPVTTLTIGSPKSGSDPIYVSLTTQFTLDATDNLSAFDYIEYNFDGGSWTTYSVAFYAPGLGTHTLHYRAVDKAGNIEDEQSQNIVVGATSLEYTGDTSGQYSDPITVSAMLIEVASGYPIPEQSISFTIGTQSTSSTTNTLGIATASIILNQSARSYSVSASFAGDSDYRLSSDSDPFTINKENAAITYTGDLFVITAGPTITKTPVRLSAHLTQENDNYPGDISLANVTFELTPTIGTPITVKNIPVNTSGDALTTYEVPVGTYSIKVTISSGNDYWIEYPFGEGSLNVALGSLEQRVTGGGWIADSQSANGKDNFGFTVNYNKNGAPKGNFLFMFRETDGYNYQVKSNSWAKGGLSFTNDYDAFFTAKATIQKIDRVTGIAESLGGDFKFVVNIHDSDAKLPQKGTDTIAVTIYNSNNTIWRQIGTTNLGGGNIVVHSK